MTLQRSTDLVYGQFGDTLLFFPRQRAVDFAQFCSARNEAKTWGEFRTLVPASLLDEINDCDEDGDPHRDNAPFNPEDALSIWWPFPQSDQYDFLPDDVVDMGEYSDTGEGDRVDFPISAEDKIVQKLRAKGYTVTRDDHLVGAATNY